MADKRTYSLATTMTVVDEDAYIAVDKSGFAEAQKLKIDELTQDLTYTSGTKTLAISNSNSVVLESLELAKNEIVGLIATASSSTQLTITGGACKDDTNDKDIEVITMVKNATPWSVGTGGGLLASGVLVKNRAYLVYAIYDDTTDATDFIAEQLGTALSYPGTYSHKRIIGGFVTAETLAQIDSYYVTTWIDLLSKGSLAIGLFGKYLPEYYLSNFTIELVAGILTINNLLAATVYDNILIRYNYTKDTTDLFAEGDGNGCLDAALTASTNYYIYAIFNLTNGSRDIFISPTAPISVSLPAGYRGVVVGYGSTDAASTLSLWKIDAKYLGEFYAYEKAILLDIVTADKYHALYSVTAADLVKNYLNGFNFKEGRIVDANITSEANTGGKLRIVCSAAHGLVAGDIVVITNANNAAHNRSTVVALDGTNPATEFICSTINYVAGAGASSAIVTEPAYLEVMVGGEGYYHAGFNVNGTASNAKSWKFELNVNVTAADNIVAKRTSTATQGAVNAEGHLLLAVGDRVWLSGKNTTDTTDITIENLNLHLHKI